MAFKHLSLAAALACVAFGAAARAQSYSGPVAVVVAIPIPAGLTRDKIEALFRQQAPAFAAIPTLKQKYFTINDETHRAGGIYLWTNAQAARDFYSDTWRARVKSTYGADAELTWFDAPVIIQGKAGMAQ
jgi:hypothetical protein